MNQVHTMGRK